MCLMPDLILNLNEQNLRRLVFFLENHMVHPVRKYLQVKCSWKGLMLNASVTRTAWICSKSSARLKSFFFFVDLLHIP